MCRCLHFGGFQSTVVDMVMRTCAERFEAMFQSSPLPYRTIFCVGSIPRDIAKAKRQICEENAETTSRLKKEENP